MSKPEHQITKFINTPGVYGFISVPVTEVVNRGRLPKSERTLTNRERKALKDRTRLQKDVTLHELDGEEIEGVLFTFKPQVLDKK
ncbi:MAG: hypothetical protein KBC00_03155 [Candidatus Levybacteria bacterium]|nr:hypothetical protein [Candidatus Levybacteria bacterium]MBP9815489.1 hypothetical protein [Candidatus Levybacteria bacterium]